tara:strand:- start:2546 stop:3793 length:1248 start_codon:yes stop_codon:yes gene_type:complete
MIRKKQSNYWDFASDKNFSLIHKIHTYPATFPAPLARELISNFSKENDLILDIFSGSGTTLLESKLLRRNSIGQDLNPLANLIAKVKTSKINLVTIDNIKEGFKQIRKVKPKFSSNKDHFWFEPETLKSLKFLKGEIDKINCKNSRDFYSLSLSQIIRKVSKLKHSGFKMHRDKNKKSSFDLKEILDLFFIPQVEKNIKAFESSSEFLASKNKSNIFFHNAKNINKRIKKSSVDLIVTSPPYGDSQSTVAYGEFAKLPHEILELGDYYNIDGSLLGGSKRSKNLNFAGSKSLNNSLSRFEEKIIKDNKNYNLQKRYNTLINFYDDLFESFSHCKTYLKQKKFLCVVISKRTVLDVLFNNDEILEDFLKTQDFQLKEKHSRNILHKRMPSKVNASNTPGDNRKTMDKEEILIFQKA